MVARRTRENSRSMDQFLDVLDGRIQSMANTHDLLSHGRWKGVHLADLVRRELEPCIGVCDATVDGPDVVLSAEATQALAMVLHELVTIDTNYRHHLRRFVNLGRAWFAKLVGSNATARSKLSTVAKMRTAPFAETVTATTPGFVVADLRNNVVQAPGLFFASQAQASDALRVLDRDPATAGKYHVIPAAEASAP